MTASGRRHDWSHCDECGRSVSEVGLEYTDRTLRYTEWTLCADCLERLERNGYMEALFE